MTELNNREKSVIYLMKQEPDGPYKLGTSKNPVIRLSTVQSGNPNKISLVEITGAGNFCARTIEGKAHRILSDYHVRGEWFNAPIEILRDAINKAKRDTDQREIIRLTPVQCTPAWEDRQAIIDLETESRRLTKMSLINYVVDYIVPLSHGDVCGLHTVENMHIVLKSKKNKINSESWGMARVPPGQEREEILTLVKQSNRYEALVSQHPHLTTWVVDQTRKHILLPFKQRIYVAVTGESPNCQYGKQRKFRTSTDGFSWCKLEHCRCKHENKLEKRRLSRLNRLSR